MRCCLSRGVSAIITSLSMKKLFAGPVQWAWRRNHAAISSRSQRNHSMLGNRAVLVPGMGDDVQAIKAGILEIADIFAINKSEQPGADRVEQELQAMLSLADGRKPAI